MSQIAVANGRYRLERLIASGGMASVHLAHDTELDRPVAVKLLADGLVDDAALRERFVREARLAARLSHPNVVGVFDCGEDDDGRPYIVTEYVEGETVADLLDRQGRLSAHEAVELAVQACAGLAHAHEKGLVHRDVKPQNLLLSRDGTLKIADFGIARALDTSRFTDAGTVLGTAAYLAPEQAADDEVTPAADVYSLGAVLYQLLTGRTPYRFESLAELASAHEPEAVPPPRELAPDVPPALEAVVMRALARDPAFRPASAARFAAELAGATVAPIAESPTAQTEALPRRPSPQAQRRRLRVLAAATVVAGALAIGLVLAARDGDGSPTPAEQRVESVRPGATPEQAARNLADWLRRHSR